MIITGAGFISDGVGRGFAKMAVKMGRKFPKYVEALPGLVMSGVGIGWFFR